MQIAKDTKQAYLLNVFLSCALNKHFRLKMAKVDSSPKWKQNLKCTTYVCLMCWYGFMGERKMLKVSQSRQ